MIVVVSGEVLEHCASMKVPTRRRGNGSGDHKEGGQVIASMKVPVRRRGNPAPEGARATIDVASVKVPARRRGNPNLQRLAGGLVCASMKVPARRRGNVRTSPEARQSSHDLNESPRPKAGKYLLGDVRLGLHGQASMKVPAQRQRNLVSADESLQRPLSPPLLPVRNRTRHSSAPLPRVASE